MQPLISGLALVHHVLHLVLDPDRHRDERGDVPGWVMVTVMTAARVAAIWAVVSPELEGMLRDALGSVN